MKLLESRDPRYILSLAIAPFERLSDVPPWGITCAGALACLQYVAMDWVSTLLIIVVITGALDFWYNSRARKKTDEPYDPDRASSGFHVKCSGLAIVGIIRLVEAWLAYYHVADTRGAVSVAIAMGLLSLDIKSILMHRQTLGGGNIPIVGVVLDWLQRLANTLVPGLAEPKE